MQNALKDATEIREAVFELASIKERATLESFGIYVGHDSESCTDEESENENDVGSDEIPACSFDVQADIENYASGEESDESSTCDGDCNEDSAINEQIDNGSTGDINSCNEGLGSGSLVRATNSTRNENSVQSLQHGEEVTRQKHLLDPDNFSKETALVNPAPTHDHLLSILRENNLNWFAFVGELEQLLQSYSSEGLEQTLLDFSEFLPWSDLTDDEERLVGQSRQAYLQRQREYICSGNHDQIHTDSESDDPEAWVDVQDALTPEGQALIRKQRAIIQRKAKREINRQIATRQILRRKVSKKISRTLAK